jgi:fatty acid desaturase
VDTTPLPPAIQGDRNSLSGSARAEIMALNGARPLAFTFQVVWAWLVIAAAISGAIYLQVWWASLLAGFVVATRHNILGLLVHEQAHLLGYRGRFGDWIVNCVAAYPLLVMSVEKYARIHLTHHRSYFLPDDPDFQRKSGEEWSTPQRPRDLAKIFLKDLLGINTLKLIKGKSAGGDAQAFARRFPTPNWVRPVYFLLVAVGLTAVGGWGAFFMYWILPILTMSQVIVRWGALCEHKYNLPGAAVAQSTPLILNRWWEKLLLPNMNFTMHPYHHYFPGISFSELPRVHQIFERENLVNDSQVFHGYGAYLKFITTPPSAAGDRSAAN